MSDVDYEIETLNDIIDYLENAIDGLNEVYEYQLAADIQYSKEEVEKKLRYFLDIEAKNLIDDPNNCIMLCAKHHRLVHTDKKYWQPYLSTLIWL